MSGKQAVIAAALIAVGAGLLARLAPPIVTTADISLIELYTDLASRGRLLLGPYSRFQWHHPGPLYFYMMAPGYVASGRAAGALYAEAAVFNLAALAFLLWTIVRERRPVQAACVGAMLLLFAVRVPRFLASPWTAHVTILPALASVGVGAAVAAGRTQLLPVMAFMVSFVVQTDLAFVPPMLAVVAVTLGAVAWRAARERHAPVRDLLAAGVVAFIVWSLPLVEAARHEGGNLAALWRFFARSDGPSHSLSEVLVAWSDNVAGVVRPHLTLAWGGHPGPPAGNWSIAVTLMLLLLLAGMAVRAWRARRVFDAWLAACTLATALAGLWGLTRVGDDILDHETFWLSALGALAAGAVVSTVVERLLRTWSSVDSRARQASAMVMIAAVVLSAVHLMDFVSFARRLPGQRDVLPAVSAIEAYLDDSHARATIIEMDAAWALGVPVVLRLRQHHRRVAVAPANLFMMTEALAPTGTEDMRLKVLPGRRGAPDDGWRLVFDSFTVSIYSRATFD